MITTPNADAPASLVINTAEQGPLVTIKPNGSIEYGPSYTPDAAARVFWEAMAGWLPGRPASPEQAEAMIQRGIDYLAEHARDRLTDTGARRVGYAVVPMQCPDGVLHAVAANGHSTEAIATIYAKAVRLANVSTEE